MNWQSNDIGRRLPAHTLLASNYEIISVIGEGGFGITYLGRDLAAERNVAIKEYFPSLYAKRRLRDGQPVLSPLSEGDQELFSKEMNRFLREANLLKELNYLDHLVRIYDCFQAQGTAYIVMEYIEGPTLEQYIASNGPLAYDEFIELFSPIMRTLIKLHQTGIIHCDISPDNLILGMDNHLHLIDFGAARQAQNHQKKANTVILKSNFAPPEQYVPAGKTGSWTDVYALSATMYFALTGKPPTAAIQHTDDETDAPPAMPHVLADWQSDALAKGLQVNPTKRFQNMEQFYLALTVEPNPSLKHTEIRQRNPRPRRRYLLIPACTGAILILLLILNGQNWFPRHTASKPANQISAATERPVSQSAMDDATASASGTAAPMQQPKAAATPSSSNHSSATSAPLLKMKDVTGKHLSKAKERLQALDAQLVIQVKYRYDSKASRGNVIAQSVAPGTIFSQGSLPAISLTVSKGRKPTTSRLPAATSSPKKPAPTKKKDYTIDDRGDDYTTIPLE